jgi:hypothetical protein
MNLWLSLKYINLLSTSVRNFRKKDTYIFNFSCPICGDSHKNKTKARGFILLKGSSFRYFCHNCSASLTFDSFLKQTNPQLYDQYLKERFLEVQQTKVEPETKATLFSIPKNKLGLKKISQLAFDHPAKKFVISRQIPTYFHSQLYFTPTFKKWTNTIKNETIFESVTLDEPRLIIPLFSRKKELYGFQGRTITSSPLKYITILFDENNPKLYGLDRLNMNKQYYVVEGPIDSMFLRNCIATCGSSLYSSIEQQQLPKQNATLIYDNEPRNKQIVQNMLTSIEKGFKIFIWPSNIEQKDINDLILKKVSNKDGYCKTEMLEKAGLYIENLIKTNTFHGLEATLKLREWRKC